MEKVEDILTVPIQLTDTLRLLTKEAGSYRHECGEMNAKAETLAQLLRLVLRGSGNNGTTSSIYIRPMHRIMQELEKSLGKALILVRKCNSSNVIKRVITITSANDFKRVNHLLDNAIADISWLLSISGNGNSKIELNGLPPIASSEPMMSLFWEQIALLERGTEEEREDAANSLGLLAKDNNRLARTIVAEGAVVPMVRVLIDGTPKAKEATARSLGCMAKDECIVKQMILDGIAPAFVKILISAPMKVQIAVAWALSEIVAMDPEQQDTFMDHSVIRPLVGLLGEGLEEPEKMQKAIIIEKLVGNVQQDRVADQGAVKPLDKLEQPSSKANNTVGGAAALILQRNKMTTRFKPTPLDSGRGLSQRELTRRERDSESPEVKAELKAQVARALWMLAKGNPKTCKSITETKALLCFATLMEKSKGPVQLNSVMALTEIAAVAEHDVELRRAAFKMSSPAARAVVDQLLRLAEQGEAELQVACIKAIGCLSRTFPARETKVVKPLVKQLEATEAIAAEAVMALEKFACTENFLHTEHCQAIVEASGANHLVQLIYFGEGQAQISAATLMCYLAIHVGDSEILAQAEPLPALKVFAKNPSLSQHPSLEKLLAQAINRLQIFQEKGARSHSDIYSYD